MSFPDPSFGNSNPYTASPDRSTSGAGASVVKPSAVTVFGVLNIIFGIWGICGVGFGLVSLFLTDLIPGLKQQLANDPGQQILNASPGYKIFLTSTLVLGVFQTFILIAGGVGLLKGQPFGRMLSIVYSWYSIIMGIVGIAGSMIFMVGPMMERANNLPPGSPEKAGAIGGAIGATCGGGIGLIYPIILLVFMYRPNIKQYFATRAV